VVDQAELNGLTGYQPIARLVSYWPRLDAITGLPDPNRLYVGLGK
jgi:hypothetical protein